MPYATTGAELTSPDAEATARWYLVHGEPGFDLAEEIEEGREAVSTLAASP